MRVFETGATRDSNEHKPDYRGFLSPSAIKRFGAYMMKHQVQADGQIRAADNWKKGIPIPAYVESLFRHTIDFIDFIEQDKFDDADEMACAMWFNLQGYLHERGKVKAAAVTADCGHQSSDGLTCAREVGHPGWHWDFRAPSGERMWDGK